MTMPRNRLVSGIRLCSDRWLGRICRRVSSDLAPERIGREVNLVVPHKIAKFTYARTAEIIVVLPRCVNSRARFLGKIHFALDAVVKPKPDPVCVEDANFLQPLHHGQTLRQNWCACNSSD